MQNLNQLKPAIIVGVLFSLFVFTSCERDNTSSTSNQNQAYDNTSSLRQANATLANCGASDYKQHFISLEYAYKMISNYQKATKKNGAVCSVFEQGGWVYSETFPVEVIQQIINQPGCCKFRIYNGMDDDNRHHVIMVGVNSQGSDILYCNANQNTGGDSCANINNLDLIAEMGNPCPQSCSGSYVTTP